MRIKLLAAIAGFLLTSIAMSSCLGGEETVEYSSNAILQSFELDTIKGVTYTFTIDQINGKVYNQDSLPVGADTIINKILITDMSVSGLMSIRNYNDTEDSLFTISDSVNLAGTMEKPFRVKVWAPDMIQTKEYTIEVRVHQQEPDSLNWFNNRAWATVSQLEAKGKMRSTVMGGTIYVFDGSSVVNFSKTVPGTLWLSAEINGLPSTELTSLTKFNGKLYATVKGSTKAFCSENGADWEEAQLGDNVERLISPIGSVLTGIINDGGTRKMANTDGAGWTVEGEMPSNFPINDMTATHYYNNIGVESIMVMGQIESPTAADTASVPWGYIEGQEWVELSTESKYKCPLLEEPQLINYGGTFYALGKDFTDLYYSVAGLVWKPVESLVMLPEALRGVESRFALAVDEDTDIIWLTRAAEKSVWRGQLNRLGFIIKE
jgi:hypothetical protein